MGLIDRIGSGQLNSAANVEQKPVGKPGEVARPCPVCGCPMWWRSMYGGELLCGNCTPWPSRSLVGDYLAVVIEDDGAFGFEDVNQAARRNGHTH